MLDSKTDDEIRACWSKNHKNEYYFKSICNNRYAAINKSWEKALHLIDVFKYALPEVKVEIEPKCVCQENDEIYCKAQLRCDFMGT